ncbi:MAG: SRPBCC domain-containing protein [Leptolyngbya sp. PLA2]|nr:SRPBCC domain-containing protein [Leptolyngbya sp.]MCE7970846.1 SRPBCC domain-containing protein [Leptolyngbya sp. PL-A2]MCQ3940339.1 SRPBCC domain-containing protein [cyanobacterium CYA1]MCZ7633685.1 SRPBCC domain-containing protein [Phycisphaerales bacterium]MDL1904591.1 SRPBCC domain-containing protein [Synechococcales cyanobacterium CNB]GIK17879.1 MAG: hypothetical protein BroJett004_00430 [Planctomycetota bacterium]
MLTSNTEDAVRSLEVTKDVVVAAPAAVVFAALLDQMGPMSEMPDGTPFPMKIEPWPGGRWFRDLGNDTGHFWGHVQVIKPPGLLEICGPLFMSYPAVNFVQYRLTAEGSGTRLKVIHKAMGQISDEHREGVVEGWGHELERVRRLAEERVGSGRRG